MIQNAGTKTQNVNTARVDGADVNQSFAITTAKEIAGIDIKPSARSICQIAQIFFLPSADATRPQ